MTTTIFWEYDYTLPYVVEFVVIVNGGPTYITTDLSLDYNGVVTSVDIMAQYRDNTNVFSEDVNVLFPHITDPASGTEEIGDCGSDEDTPSLSFYVSYEGFYNEADLSVWIFNPDAAGDEYEDTSVSIRGPSGRFLLETTPDWITPNFQVLIQDNDVADDVAYVDLTKSCMVECISDNECDSDDICIDNMCSSMAPPTPNIALVDVFGVCSPFDGPFFTCSIDNNPTRAQLTWCVDFTDNSFDPGLTGIEPSYQLDISGDTTRSSIIDSNDYSSYPIDPTAPSLYRYVYFTPNLAIGTYYMNLTTIVNLNGIDYTSLQSTSQEFIVVETPPEEGYYPTDITYYNADGDPTDPPYNYTQNDIMKISWEDPVPTIGPPPDFSYTWTISGPDVNGVSSTWSCHSYTNNNITLIFDPTIPSTCDSDGAGGGSITDIGIGEFTFSIHTCSSCQDSCLNESTDPNQPGPNFNIVECLVNDDCNVDGEVCNANVCGILGIPPTPTITPDSLNGGYQTNICYIPPNTPTYKLYWTVDYTGNSFNPGTWDGPAPSFGNYYTNIWGPGEYNTDSIDGNTYSYSKDIDFGTYGRTDIYIAVIFYDTDGTQYLSDRSFPYFTVNAYIIPDGGYHVSNILYQHDEDYTNAFYEDDTMILSWNSPVPVGVPEFAFYNWTITDGTGLSWSCSTPVPYSPFSPGSNMGVNITFSSTETRRCSLFNGSMTITIPPGTYYSIVTPASSGVVGDCVGPNIVGQRGPSFTVESNDRQPSCTNNQDCGSNSYCDGDTGVCQEVYPGSTNCPCSKNNGMCVAKPQDIDCGNCEFVLPIIQLKLERCNAQDWGCQCGKLTEYCENVYDLFPSEKEKCLNLTGSLTENDITTIRNQNNSHDTCRHFGYC